MATQYAETSLSQPYYGASFGIAFSRFWKKYATFSGRASRSEFWWWYLVQIVVVGVLYAVMLGGAFSGSSHIDPSTGIFVNSPGPLYGVGLALLIVWALATIVPTLAIAWRRLHDANFAGPFYFLGLIPFVGGIILLVLFLMPSKPEGARFD